MTADPDEKLASLVPDGVWWNGPPVLPETGDAAIDKAMIALDRGSIEEARELARTSTARHFAELVIATAERIEAEHRPFEWAPERDIPVLPQELQAHARLLYKQAYRAHDMRRALIRRMVVLLEDRMDGSLEGRVLAAIERPCSPGLREALAGMLLGWRWAPGPIRKVETIAGAEHLRVLGKHILPEDPLLAFAAQALLVLEPESVHSRIASFVAGLPTQGRPAALREIARGIAALVPFDRQPEWADLLSPILGISDPAAMATLNHLVACRTPGPLVKALNHVTDETVFATLLDAVRELADASAIAGLEELARSLPDTPTKVARSKKSVLAVVKRLKKLGSGPQPTLLGGVGTDGGPLVLLTESAASAWGGASSPAWREPLDSTTTLPDDDYGRACRAVEAKPYAFISIENQPALVLGSQACDVVTFEERIYLVTEGEARAVDTVRLPKSRAKGKQETLNLTHGGLIVLDATLTVATADSEQKLHLAAQAGKYSVSQITSSNEGTTAVVLIPNRETKSGEEIPKKPRKKVARKA